MTRLILPAALCLMASASFANVAPFGLPDLTFPAPITPVPDLSTQDCEQAAPEPSCA